MVGHRSSAETLAAGLSTGRRQACLSGGMGGLKPAPTGPNPVDPPPAKIYPSLRADDPYTKLTPSRRPRGIR